MRMQAGTELEPELINIEADIFTRIALAGF